MKKILRKFELAKKKKNFDAYFFCSECIYFSKYLMSDY